MKRFSEKAVAIILSLAMLLSVFSVSVSAEGEKTLKFDENGKFRIMHVTDTHLEESNLKASVWAIGEACDLEKPDLVVITGDNVQNCADPADTKKLIDGLMNVFETRNIPVAVTFGNHDSESGAMSREELMAYYNTFSCSVSVDDGEALSGCGTYNLPVMSSDGTKVKFNIWVFDSNDYDEKGNYSCVQADQVEWYKAKSDELTAANGGEKVYSLAFQHIIVAEIFDGLKKIDSEELFSVKNIYTDEYYVFDPEAVNYGTLMEKPCPGLDNFGQFDAMVEKGDVLGLFTGHDHTNAFGVTYKGIVLSESLSTRYNGDRYSTQYGYRILEIDENDTSVFTSKVVHWFDIFDIDYATDKMKNGDNYGFRTSLDIAFKGFFQKVILWVYIGFGELVTGRKVSYN